jgi:hypothetical protein
MRSSLNQALVYILTDFNDANLTNAATYHDLLGPIFFKSCLAQPRVPTLAAMHSGFISVHFIKARSAEGTEKKTAWD